MRAKDNLLIVILALAAIGWLVYRSGGSGAFGGEPAAPAVQRDKEARESRKKDLLAEIEALQKRIDGLKKELADLENGLPLQMKAGDEIRTPVVLRFKGKRLIEADVMKGRLHDFLLFNLTWTNNTPKAIRAFKGTIIFKDVMGDVITGYKWTYEKRIKPGETITEDTKGAEINAFSPTDQRLKTVKSADLKAEFKLSSILYDDGTKEDF